MKKLTISFILLVLFCISSQAQGLYKTQYKYNNSTVTYEGLLAWYGVGQPSFMRIKYYHPDLRRYVLAQESVTFIPVQNGYVLKGSNAFILPPVPSGHTFNPDSFIFGPTPYGYFGCLAAVDDVGRQIGAVSEFRPLMPYEVASTLQAFGFSNANNNYTPSSNASSATMHLIVVANTEDEDIGAGDAIDANAVTKEFGIAANEIGIGFRPIIISGSMLSRNNVVTTLNNLNPSSNDIVVFVYTGHGFRFDDDSDPYPRFALTRNRQSVVGNNLSGSEVYNALKRKGARLNITIIDSCNSKIGLNKPNDEGGLVLKPSDAGISRRAVTALFLNTRGNIIMAAASKGETSATNSTTGGYFMHAFMNAFMYETSLVNTGTPSWQTIISSARSNAYSSSGSRQTAIYGIE
jgi:hypothetical protein